MGFKSSTGVLPLELMPELDEVVELETATDDESLAELLRVALEESLAELLRAAELLRELEEVAELELVALELRLVPLRVMDQILKSVVTGSDTGKLAPVVEAATIRNIPTAVNLAGL